MSILIMQLCTMCDYIKKNEKLEVCVFHTLSSA